MACMAIVAGALALGGVLRLLRDWYDLGSSERDVPVDILAIW